LLQHGFRYLSDELAPIDLNRWEVHPYPRALCLKDATPAFYPLPTQTFSTSHAMYIPIEHLPGGMSRLPSPLAAIFFLRYAPETFIPSVRRLSAAEAGVRLFASALNPLAHPGDGLDAALAITTRSACFTLDIADLPTTCALVSATLQEFLPGVET
jgi:hypothetical protein